MTQTARRQLSVRLGLLLTTVFVVSLLAGGVADADHRPPPTVEYVVTSGDTLWEIASLHSGPDVDIRNLIADIKELSGVESSNIHPGQVLRIPAS